MLLVFFSSVLHVRRDDCGAALSSGFSPRRGTRASARARADRRQSTSAPRHRRPPVGTTSDTTDRPRWHPPTPNAHARAGAHLMHVDGVPRRRRPRRQVPPLVVALLLVAPPLLVGRQRRRRRGRRQLLLLLGDQRLARRRVGGSARAQRAGAAVPAAARQSCDSTPRRSSPAPWPAPPRPTRTTSTGAGRGRTSSARTP